MDKKVVIFIKPLSENLIQLKEVLAKDAEIDLYEEEDIFSAIELSTTLQPALWISSSPKKTLNFMSLANFKANKIQSKFALISQVELPERAIKKMNQMGIKDILFEPISPKVLTYKINFLIKSLPKIKKSTPNRVNVGENSDVNNQNQSQEMKVEKLINSGLDELPSQSSLVKNETDFKLAMDEKKAKDDSSDWSSYLVRPQDEKKKRSLNALVDEENLQKNKKSQSGLQFAQDDQEKEKKGSSGILTDLYDRPEEKNRDSLTDLYSQDGPGIRVSNKTSLSFFEEQKKRSEHNGQTLAYDVDSEKNRDKKLDLAIVDDDENGLKKKNKNSPLLFDDDKTKNDKDSLLDLVDDTESKKNKSGNLVIEDDIGKKHLDKDMMDLMVEPENGKKSKSETLSLYDENKSSKAARGSLVLEYGSESKDAKPDQSLSLFDPEDTSTKKQNTLLDIDPENEPKKRETSLALDLEDDRGSKGQENLSLFQDGDGKAKRNNGQDLKDLFQEDQSKIDEISNPLIVEDAEREKDKNLENDNISDISLIKNDSLTLNFDDENKDARSGLSPLEMEEGKTRGKENPLLVDINDDENLKKSKSINLSLVENDEKDHKPSSQVDEGLYNRTQSDYVPMEPLAEPEKKDFLKQILEIDDSWDFIQDEVLLNLDKLTPNDISELNLKMEKNHWGQEEANYDHLKKALKDHQFDNSHKKYKEFGGGLTNSQEYDDSSTHFQVKYDKDDDLYKYPDSIVTANIIDADNSVVHVPHTRGIEFLIDSLKLVQNHVDQSKKLLEYASHSVFKKKKGFTNFLIYQKGKDSLDEFYLGTTSIPEILKSAEASEFDWNNVKKENMTRWQKTLIPSWSDPTFRAHSQEFIFPYYDGVQLLGVSVSFFQEKVSESDSKAMETIMECGRFCYLEKNFRLDFQDSDEEKNKNDDGFFSIKNIVKKVKGLFSRLFS